MTSAEFRREKLARREEHEYTAMKDEIQELKDQHEKMNDQNEKTKTELLAQMELEIRKINDQNEQTKTELLAQVHELKNLLRQLVDK